MVHIFDKQGLRVIGVGLMLGVSSYIHGELSNINALTTANYRVVTFEGFCQFHGLAPMSASSANAFFRLNNPSIVSTTSHDDALNLVAEPFVNQWIPAFEPLSVSLRQIESNPSIFDVSYHNDHRSYNIERQIVLVFSVLNDHALYHPFYSSNAETRAGPAEKC